MSIKKKTNSNREANELQELGFEFRSPQDEFSYQPDSGSVIGGIRGKQEYGIDSNLDAEGGSSQRKKTIPLSQNPTLTIPGESEWSQAHRLPIEEVFNKEKIIELTDPQLQMLVLDRLSHHPRLKDLEVDVHVENGEVDLQGEVSSISAKMQIEELIEALPGVIDIHNNIEVYS
ncbi:MAG: BON domain-containing protein [bacterium]|nr:BON domain-containing protein [bacterium]